MLAAGACSHAEPARSATVECRGSAKADAVAGLSGSEACTIVRDATLAALHDRPGQADISIVLDLSRRGSAVARVQEIGPAGTRALPEIAVDVMDRPLGREDLVRLAELIARTLASGPQS